MKVINVINHPPPYDLYKDLRPPVNWDLADGQWAGIWGTDWPDILAGQILRITNEYQFEVWQPDLRVKRVHSHRFGNGVVHRLVPAQLRRTWHGFKRVENVVSYELQKQLAVEDRSETILHLHGSFNPLLLQTILRNGDMPIVHTIHGTLYLPSSQIFKLRKNIAASCSYWRQARLLKSLSDRIDSITYMNDFNSGNLRRLFPSRCVKLTMGCDFDRWRPLDKSRCRSELNLPPDRFVLFGSSRFEREKQIIPFLRILCELCERYDFLYILSGHGESAFESQLLDVAGPLLERGMLRLTGYLSDSELLKYYSAADLFVLTSTNEGASVAVMKALACEVPLFVTETGNTSEVLRTYHAGEIVPVADFSEWRRRLERILQGHAPKKLPRSIALRHYHWPEIARRFLVLYDSLSKIPGDDGPTVVDAGAAVIKPVDHKKLNYESVKG